MRYDNLIRFFVIAFVAGSALGLISGLVLKSGGGTADAQDDGSGFAGGGLSGEEVETMTPEQAETIGANEMGRIMVLEYHKIGRPESEWTRTPENFEADIQMLIDNGYYPVNLRDFATRSIQVPAGMTPVAITFDDSSPGQYRIRSDGTLDPESAVGILQDFAESADWAPRATFFCLLDVQPNDNVLFGQPELEREKLRNLVEFGYEVGSHTITHLNLKEAATDEARKQLAVSQTTLEGLAGDGYEVVSLSVPFGAYPEDDNLLAEGSWEDSAYTYDLAVEVTGGPSPSPFSTDFQPLHVPRIQVRDGVIEKWIAYFDENPGLRYVSDGDPAAVSAPNELPEDLGTLASGLGRPLIRY